MWRCTDPRLDETGWVHRHLDGFPPGGHFHAARSECLRAIARALAEGRHTETEIAAFGARFLLPSAELRHVDGFDRRFHGFDIGRSIEDEARHRCMGKALHQVAAADLHRV